MAKNYSIYSLPQDLPRLEDRWSFLFVERARIHQSSASIRLLSKYHPPVRIPCAHLAALILGPGTSITHQAVINLADAGVTILWMQLSGTHLVATGINSDRNMDQLVRQAKLHSDSKLKLDVCQRMYEFRFGEDIPPESTADQLRGREGSRIKELYKQQAQKFGVVWRRRDYDTVRWEKADMPNRALSSANAALYAVVHAAITTLGYSPSLGFLHGSFASSFVYDIADLYKPITSIPAAFETAGDPLSHENIESNARKKVRKKISEANVLERISSDIEYVLGIRKKHQEIPKAPK